MTKQTNKKDPPTDLKGVAAYRDVRCQHKKKTKKTAYTVRPLGMEQKQKQFFVRPTGRRAHGEPKKNVGGSSQLFQWHNHEATSNDYRLLLPQRTPRHRLCERRGFRSLATYHNKFKVDRCPVSHSVVLSFFWVRLGTINAHTEFWPNCEGPNHLELYVRRHHEVARIKTVYDM